MHIWSLFRFTAATGVAVGTASAAQSRTMDGDPCECKPTSVGAAESHLCSSSHPHPFPWVSIVPVGLCSEPDWAPDPAVTALGEKAVTTQLDQHLELLPSVITQLLLQGRGETVLRGQEERVNTAPCVHIGSRTYGTITLLNRTRSVAKRWACWGLCQSVF